MQIHQQNLDIKRSLFSCFGIHWIAFVILFMFPLKSHALCVDGDCFNGKGTYYFADGGVYKGDWTKGKMHGNGRFTFEKDWVDGIWNQGKLVKIVRRKPRPP